jgi:hypothetical protein
VGSDFPNYYVAAKVVREGEDPVKLYDDGWFQAQIYASGFRQLGKFSPFPPPTAFLLFPLTGFSPLAALRTVTVLNLIMIATAALLVSGICEFNLLESSAFVLLSGVGLINCLRLGQLYIGVSWLMLLGFLLLARGREWWAGICLALPVPFKYFPVIFLAYLGTKRRWKVMASSAIVLAGLCTASVAILGWPVHSEFFQSVLPNHIRSNLSQQDPFSAAFQSFDSLLRRLFVHDPARNPHPVMKSRELYLALKVTIILSLTVLAALGIRRAERKGGPAQRLSISLLGILGLLIAPATATYHFVLLWLPVGLLLSHLRETSRPRLFAFSLGLYAAIGLLPYPLFQSMSGPGLRTLVAYPRLWFMCALFSAALAAAFGKETTAVHASRRSKGFNFPGTGARDCPEP